MVIIAGLLLAGCRKDDAAQVAVPGVPPAPTHIQLAVDSFCVQAPNVITPNGDGINDRFHVVSRWMTDLTVVITTATGDTVHVDQGVNNAWQPAEGATAGPYIVRVRATTTSGQMLQGQGSLHLLAYGASGCLPFIGMPVTGDQLDPRLCGPAYDTNELFCP